MAKEMKEEEEPTAKNEEGAGHESGFVSNFGSCNFLFFFKVLEVF